jgi:hypothetical protein
MLLDAWFQLIALREAMPTPSSFSTGSKSTIQNRFWLFSVWNWIPNHLRRARAE